MNSTDYSKVTVLIIAKLLQHDEPITANEIVDYINQDVFQIRDKPSVKQVAGMIKKHNNSKFRQVKVLKRHFKIGSNVVNGYVMRG